MQDHDLVRRSQSNLGSIFGKLGIAALVGAAALGIYYLTGKKEPHNHVVSGVVTRENELYGNLLLGYATDRSGVRGTVEKNVFGFVRPGPPMRLYEVIPTKLEYDTTEWHKTTHHCEEFSPDNATLKQLEETYGKDYPKGIYIQTEGNMADVGDMFTAPLSNLGRPSKAFLLRGIRYTIEDNGEEKTHLVNFVLKNPSFIKFEKPSNSE